MLWSRDLMRFVSILMKIHPHLDNIWTFMQWSVWQFARSEDFLAFSTQSLKYLFSLSQLKLVLFLLLLTRLLTDHCCQVTEHPPSVQSYKDKAKADFPCSGCSNLIWARVRLAVGMRATSVHLLWYNNSLHNDRKPPSQSVLRDGRTCYENELRLCCEGSSLSILASVAGSYCT